MIWLYRIAILPFFLIAGPYYLWRMLKRGGYAKDFAQRFGSHPNISPKKNGTRRIWIHAVSLGEMRCIEKCVRALASRADTEVFISTTTSTGYALGKDIYRDLASSVFYFPIDFWPFSRRTWKAIEPDAFVLTEGELWPEALYQANVRGCKTFLINARMSERSHRRYQKFSFFSRWVYGMVDRILAGTELDAERIREIARGCGERIQTVGNLKLDVPTPAPLDPQEREAQLKEIGFMDEQSTAKPLIVMGSSTWPGEESALIDAYRKLKTSGIDSRLLLVPRHAERRHEVEKLLQNQEFSYRFRTQLAEKIDPCEIYVADTSGELGALTQLADIVFVGKSLGENRGGQSPIEAAAAGKAILAGRNMGNFKTIARQLEAAGGTARVQDASELEAKLIELCKDDELRSAMGMQAQRFVLSNGGAAERTINALEDALK